MLERVISVLIEVNWLKTFWFNFHHFRFSEALQLPFLVYWKTGIRPSKGSIKILAPVSFGMCRLGKPIIGIQDQKHKRTIWQLGKDTELLIKGRATIGRGCRFCIEPGGKVTLGNLFLITGDATVLCRKEITFGEDCMLSWDVLVMDSDWHDIKDRDGKVLNEDAPVSFEDHVWVGCRSTILKGAVIPSGCVIAAGTLITRHLDEPNAVYAECGKNVAPVKRQIHWEH